MTTLAVWEAVTGASGIAARIEVMLPAGVRRRQLTVRTLLAGICLACADDRPAHLTRVHRALTALDRDDQRRLGVIASWKHGPHLLTCRQTERTHGLVADALASGQPDGLPSPALQAVCDSLAGASIPEEFKHASRPAVVDWTGLESFSRPRRTAPATAPTPRHASAHGTRSGIRWHSAGPGLSRASSRRERGGTAVLW